MAKKKLLEEVKKINIDRLMVIENLKTPILFDIPREYVLEMNEIFDQNKIAEEIKKLKDKEEYLKMLGNKVSDRLFELEKKYRDRTGEVIDSVAQKTGIYFPHVFQRYIEYFYIGTRPEDRYNVSASTVRELKINFPSCTFKRLLIQNGMGDRICSEFCRTVLNNISTRLKMNLRISIKQDRGVDYCEHQFFAVGE